MRIAPEGWPFIVTALLIAGALAAFRLWIPFGAWMLIAIWVIAFFRDPVRQGPRGDKLVKFLVERGASITAANKAGLTPLDVAQGAGGRRGGRGPVRESTVALLKQLMASSP